MQHSGFLSARGYVPVFLTLAFLALTLLIPQGARAQAPDWPSKPIRFIVSSPAGGVVDIRARRFGQRLAEILKQPIVVENKPGASTTIGADFVAKSAPDGYTALFGGNTEVVVAPALNMPIKYDPIKDFTPVAQFTQGSPLLVVNASLGPKTFQELVAWAKANPGKLMCGTSGHGSGQHFTCELLKRTAKIDLNSVAYKGTGPMLLDTAGGQVHIAIGYLAEVERQYIQTGKVIPIAALAPKRLEKYPNIPTMTELGLEGFELLSWTGLFMPAGVPREAVTRMNAAITQVVREPEFVQWLKDTGSEVVFPTPEQFRDFQHRDLAKWKKQSDELGIKAEGQ